MSDDFMEQLAAAMTEAIENPGTASARVDGPTIHKPAGWTDAEWDEWIEGVRDSVPQVGLDEEAREA